MSGGEETPRFEAMLRRRGVGDAFDEAVDREIWERYRDRCAVLVLDASGFTRITQQNGILHFLAMVMEMRDRAAPIFAAHQAHGTWYDADNAYGIFPEPRHALAAAFEMQRQTAAENTGRPAGERLHVCIGIGYGELLRIGGENVYGDQMNLASKLGEDVAKAGEILLTESAYEAVKPHYPDANYEERHTRIGRIDIPHWHIDIVRQG